MGEFAVVLLPMAIVIAIVAVMLLAQLMIIRHFSLRVTDTCSLHFYTVPDVFVTYFTLISSIYNYNTRGKNLYFTTTETETGKMLSRIKVVYDGINFQKALKQLSLWLSLNIELEIILFLII